MVLNPGGLAAAPRACGREDCHPEVVERVRASIMATNKGMLNTLYYHWETPGELAASPVDVPALLDPASPGGEDAPRPLAQDQFAKMCAVCHLWKEREYDAGDTGLRGGGCSACHVVELGDAARPDAAPDPELRKFTHSRLSTRIPDDNCVRCHNRSARQGIAYRGQFESEGYGTPWSAGTMGPQRLAGGRFYTDLPADVHHASGTMACIDCHTHLGLMGDGKRYEYMEEQQDVRCEDCHEPRLEPLRASAETTRRLAALNRKVPALGDRAAYTRKGAALYNLRLGLEGWVLFRKLDGEPVPFQVPEQPKAHHSMPGHERLSCQACHSRHMPQCYGCHIAYRLDETQEDKLSGRETPGRWLEKRSYLRFEQPVLGLKDEETIAPFAPSHAFVSVFGPDGDHLPERSPHTAAMTTFDPHTTMKASRTCADCHATARTLGLGAGALRLGPDGPEVSPLYDATAWGLDHAPEALGDAQGNTLQRSSRPWRRAFNRKELLAITRVAACLPCHKTYDDPVYADFRASLQRFRNDPDVPCPAAGPAP
jgi:hypothetical protein